MWNTFIDELDRDVVVVADQLNGLVPDRRFGRRLSGALSTLRHAVVVLFELDPTVVNQLVLPETAVVETVCRREAVDELE